MVEQLIADADKDDRYREFFQNPSYQAFAILNSVLEPQVSVNNTQFFDWTSQNTNMLLALKSQQKEKSNADKLIIDSIEEWLRQV